MFSFFDVKNKKDLQDATRNQSVDQIATGDTFSFILRNNNQIVCYGTNWCGDMSGESRLPKKVIKVVAGADHVLFLMEDGTVMGCGANHYGQLGIADQDFVSTPTLIPGLINIRDIIAADRNSMAINKANEAWVFGANFNGSLGCDQKPREAPFLHPLKNIKMASMGSCHTLFETNDGKMFACGRNSDGQLGLGDKKDRYVPTEITSMQNVTDFQVSGMGSLFLKDKKVFYCGRSGNGESGLGNHESCFVPTLIPTLDHIKKIKAGECALFCIDDEDNLYGWGLNAIGEAGVLDGGEECLTPKLVKQSVKDIYTTCRSFFAFCTDFDDQVFGWGVNDHGQLGIDNSKANLNILKNSPSCKTLYYPSPTPIPQLNAWQAQLKFIENLAFDDQQQETQQNKF